ncbi:MAG: hypothetical protein CVT86_02550 [Alphaproteobacteria bacterium HGW-Alphaproteobacteria-8]|nr:MAG: hypothetical protein CVT86_02550 [Alphaproteobacteria bacterium HGW-Alphaproteobacteria-8]
MAVGRRRRRGSLWPRSRRRAQRLCRGGDRRASNVLCANAADSGGGRRRLREGRGAAVRALPRPDPAARRVMRAEAPVLHVYRGGGAEQAGVPDRSRLLDIDGRPVAGLDAEAIASLLRGEEGSVVKLDVAPPGGQRMSFTVRRQIFSPLDVELIPPGSQRVVRIREFVGGLTRPALRATLEFVSGSASVDNTARVIIDLRDAPGGDLYEAFDLAGLFLPPGTLLGTIRGRDGYAMEIHASQGDKYSMPLTLLVGPETASAAEIFAGVLRRHERALLVGQTTYGKCASQTDARLSDGSVLRYTNKEVLFPGGGTCTGTGLTPDLAVGDDELDMLSRLVERAQSFSP